MIYNFNMNKALFFLITPLEQFEANLLVIKGDFYKVFCNIGFRIKDVLLGIKNPVTYCA